MKVTSRMATQIMVVAALWVAPAAHASHGSTGDFNGDGFGDIAIGAPGETVAGEYAAGAVNVIYGSRAGLTDAGNELWTQASAGVADAPEAEDEFGSAIATGDFDHDGFSDLAIGAPGEDTDSFDRGAVHVLYGSPSGLGDRLAFIANPTDDESRASGDRFGASLAAGDFEGDRAFDLAIGVPGEKVGGWDRAGAVVVVYGEAGDGLRVSSETTEEWNQDAAGVAGRADVEEEFGYALARRDFNRDGRSDLAIGIPGERVGSVPAGAVAVLYGSSQGLTPTGQQLWTQNSPDVKDTSSSQWDVDGEFRYSERFGAALAAGDFDGDDYGDLAIGVPWERVGPVDEPPEFDGAVNVLYGSAGGLSASGDDFWTEDSPGVKGTSGGHANAARFGSALAAADFDGDGFSDLAIGGPFDADIGSVTVLYGSSRGLTADRDQLWRQDSSGVLGSPNDGDRFGASLLARDVGRSARAELAIGVPMEEIAGRRDAGRVHVLYGTSTGLSASGDQVWQQSYGSGSLQGSSEPDDLFGTL